MNKVKPAAWISWPFFPYLLPLFFVVHGLVGNYPLLWSEIVRVLVLYSCLALILSLVFRWLFRNIRKANLFVLVLFVFHFFFGSYHDFLKNQFGQSFISKYTVIVPLALMGLLAIFFLLKKSNRRFIRLSRYLNILMLVLIFWDLGVLAWGENKAYKTPMATSLVSVLSVKPDVYLILVDEYAGKKELLDLFGYDNRHFEDSLRVRRFWVTQNARSNYNYTVYSMASLLNMQYLQNLPALELSADNISICRKLIWDNELVRFFKNNGYEIRNLSFFDLKYDGRAITSRYFKPADELLLAQTFTHRFNFDLGHHFASEAKIKRILNVNLINNQIIEKLLRETLAINHSAPRFTYAHFLMPHHPYYFDRNGNKVPEARLADHFKSDKKAYLEYLLYCNQKLLGYIDYIKTRSAAPPVIVLLSDHGFRQFTEPVEEKYHFMTINAVYFPNEDYKGFYEGMSHVNVFRTILNSQFGQHIPILKDTSIFIREK